MKKILIYGSFDILHPGHLYLIKEAQKYGEVHAGFALDETILKVKGRLPYHSLEARMRAIEPYGVIPHAGDPVDRLRVTREVDPAIVMLGYDQHVFVEKLEQYRDAVKPMMKIVRSHLFYRQYFSSSKFRKVIEDPNAGFILIDKPTGEPSLKTVTKLRTLTGIRRIGFAGTLDPLASGLLVCGISSATTLLDWFHFFPKTYEAEMALGSVSDTYDGEGVITKVSGVMPSAEEIHSISEEFMGASEQEPPMYSAKKVGGKKLYEFARSGETVAREKHAVTIHALTVSQYTYPKVTFSVTCSSGTYVRTLIHDIGQRLGVGAYMTALRRTGIGAYRVDAALPIDMNRPMDIAGRLLSAEELRQRINEYFWSSWT